MVDKGYKTTCANCGKENNLIKNGFSYCFNCGATKRLNAAQYKNYKSQLVRSKYLSEIRDYYKFLARYYHSCLSSDHREYLNLRGINDQYIDRYMLGYCPNEYNGIYSMKEGFEAGISTKDSKSVLANRITFPYIVNDMITDIRGRAIEYDEVKYKSPYGTAYYRGSDYPYNFAALEKDTVVLTEGEIKSVVSQEINVSCVALPGMNSWKNAIVQRENQKIILCFDNQIDNRYELIQAYKRAAERIKEPFIATLPLRGAKKADIDSFILEHGIREYKRVIDGALPYKEWLDLIS